VKRESEKLRLKTKECKEAEADKVKLAKNLGESQATINLLNGEVSKLQAEASRHSVLTNQIAEIFKNKDDLNNTSDNVARRGVEETKEKGDEIIRRNINNLRN